MTMPSERQLLAERWRQLGELLRERSPALFEKLLDMITASAAAQIDSDDENIRSTYQMD